MTEQREHPLGASCHLGGGTRDLGLTAQGVSRAYTLQVFGQAGREAVRGGDASRPSGKETPREDPISQIRQLRPREAQWLTPGLTSWPAESWTVGPPPLSLRVHAQEGIVMAGIHRPPQVPGLQALFFCPPWEVILGPLCRCKTEAQSSPEACSGHTAGQPASRPGAQAADFSRG